MAYINGKKVLTLVRTAYLNASDEVIDFINEEYDKSQNTNYGAILHDKEINEVVYDGYNSVTFNSGESVNILETTLEANHTYLIIANIDLNFSDSYIMSGTIGVFNGNTQTANITTRTTASNGGGTSLSYILTPQTYAPTIKISSYNYTSSNNAPVRGSLQIIKLK